MIKRHSINFDVTGRAHTGGHVVAGIAAVALAAAIAGPRPAFVTPIQAASSAVTTVPVIGTTADRPTGRFLKQPSRFPATRRDG